MRHGTQTGKATELKPWRDCLWVRLPPVLLAKNMRRLGIGEPSSGCNPPAFGAVQVQLLPGALTTWPVGLAAGCESLKLAARVRFPYGLLTAKWWNR